MAQDMVVRNYSLRKGVKTALTCGDYTIIQFGYITPQELELLQKQGSGGDILGQFFDKDGNRLNLDFHISTNNLSKCILLCIYFS